LKNPLAKILRVFSFTSIQDACTIPIDSLWLVLGLGWKGLAFNGESKRIAIPNSVHPNSKQAMAAFARKSTGCLIHMLKETGMSYEAIETALRLVKRNGMTAWELADPHNKQLKIE
jgi:hypothetical protein